jgi:hypothetical protein
MQIAPLTKQLPCIFWGPQAHYRILKKPPLITSLSHVNSHTEVNKNDVFWTVHVLSTILY